MIVDKAARAKDWDNFVLVAGYCQLKKVLTVASQLITGWSYFVRTSKVRGERERGSIRSIEAHRETVSTTRVTQTPRNDLPLKTNKVAVNGVSEEAVAISPPTSLW